MTVPRLTASADGWRGIIGQSFTPESVGKLADGVMRVISQQSDAPTSVLICYDGRMGGAVAAASVAEAVAAYCHRVRIVRHMATPTAVSAVRRGQADVALLITASHNPPHWNGLKVKVRPGCPLAPDLEALVEEEIGGPPGNAALSGPGHVEAATTWTAEHVEEMTARVATARAKSLQVVIDGLSGVGGTPVAKLCAALGWHVRTVGCTPAPDFGGSLPDPSLAASRRRAMAAVTETGADLGLILDGDGDRIYVVDDRGRDLRPDELLALLIDHRRAIAHDERRTRKGIAITVSTGSAVRMVAQRWGDPVYELPVGFKHLAPLLLAGQVDSAGGAVGDLTFAEFGVDRDPLAAVVVLADLLTARAVPLAVLLDDLRAEVGPLRWFESRLADIPAEAFSRDLTDAAVKDAGLTSAVIDVTEVDGMKYRFDAGQWLLFRRSSTEGGVRIYGELTKSGPAPERVAAALRAAAEI